jgi:hypothetical protein
VEFEDSHVAAPEIKSTREQEQEEEDVEHVEFEDNSEVAAVGKSREKEQDGVYEEEEQDGIYEEKEQDGVEHVEFEELAEADATSVDTKHVQQHTDEAARSTHEAIREDVHEKAEAVQDAQTTDGKSYMVVPCLFNLSLLGSYLSAVGKLGKIQHIFKQMGWISTPLPLLLMLLEKQKYF